ALADNGKQYRAVFSNSSGSTLSGAASLFVRTRVTVPSDVDGDGLADLTVWRPANGTWFSLTSSTVFDYNLNRQIRWGSQAAGDARLMGAIDGDGRADFVVWRPGTAQTGGTFFWLTSSTNFTPAAAGAKQWGNSSLGDTPMLADMDGDGKADLVVVRP